MRMVGTFHQAELDWVGVKEPCRNQTGFGGAAEVPIEVSYRTAVARTRYIQTITSSAVARSRTIMSDLHKIPGVGIP